MMLNLLRIGYNRGLTGVHNISQYYAFAFRDPTVDKCLIEFMLSLPNSHFVNGKGECKLLIKKAMKGILPDKVLFQKGKGLQSSDSVMRVQSDIPEIESIIHNFKTDFYDGELYDKPRMCHDLARSKRIQTNATSNPSPFTQCWHYGGFEYVLADITSRQPAHFQESILYLLYQLLPPMDFFALIICYKSDQLLLSCSSS